MVEMKKAVLGVSGGATGCWPKLILAAAPDLIGRAEAESM